MTVPRKLGHVAKELVANLDAGSGVPLAYSEAGHALVRASKRFEEARPLISFVVITQPHFGPIIRPPLGSAADGTTVLWPDAATDLANPQGLAMAVLYWRLMGSHWLSTTFAVDAGYKAFAVSVFMLLEAPTPPLSGRASGRSLLAKVRLE